MKGNLLRRGLVGMLSLMLLPGTCPINVMASEIAEPSEQQIVATEAGGDFLGEGEVFTDELAEDTIQAGTFQVAIIKPDIFFAGRHYVLKAKPIGVGNLNPDNYTYEWFVRVNDWRGGWNPAMYLEDNQGYRGTHTDTLSIGADLARGLQGTDTAWFGCRVTSKYPLVETDTDKREVQYSSERIFIPNGTNMQPYDGMLWFTDLDHPVAGATPDYTAESKDSDLFEFDHVEWFKNDPNQKTGWSQMEPTDQYGVGTYMCHLFYNMGIGLYPGNVGAILQNGERDARVYYEEDTTFDVVPQRYIEAFYDVKNELTDVPFSHLAVPVEGITPDTSVLAPAGLKVTEVFWSPKDEKIVGGKEYTATIVAEAEEGYTIADKANVTVDGKPMELLKYPGNQWLCKYTFPTTVPLEKNPAILSDRNLLMNITDVYTIKEKGIVLEGVLQYGEVKIGDTLRLTYYDQAQEKAIEVKVENLTFKDGKYALLIGKPFGMNADGSVNKSTLSRGAVLQKTDSYLQSGSLALIGNLQVRSEEETRTVREGEEVDCFIGGKSYTAKILSLNGQNAVNRGDTVANVVIGDFEAPFVRYLGQPIAVRKDGRNVGTFTVVGLDADIDQYVTSVSVNVTAPEIGNVPDQNATISDGNTGYKVESVSWSPAGSTFAENTAYTVTIKAVADDSKIFSKNVAVRINGENVTPTSGAETDTLIFSYTFPKLGQTLEESKLTKVSFAENGVKLTWKLTSGVDAYKLYRKLKDGSYKPLEVVTVTEEDRNAGTMTWTDATVSNNTDYVYTIRYYDQAKEACYGAYDKVGKAIHYLQAPSNVRFESKAEGLLIRWDAVEGAEKYRVFVDEAGTWKSVAVTTEAEYLYEKAEKGKSYRFTIKCVADNGSTTTSGYKEEGYEGVYNPEMQPTPLKMPMLKLVSNTSNGVKVSWGAVEGAELYRVFYKEAGGAWKSAGYTANTNYTVSKLVAGTSYSFTVRCVTADRTKYISDYNKAGLSIKYEPVLAIGLQPQDVTVMVGVKAIFSIKATGDGLTYQWQYSKDNGTTWSTPTAASAKTAKYSFAAKESQNGFLLRCIVKDSTGKNVKSNAARLLVPSAGPVIITQPKSISVTAGQKASFKIVAVGEGVTYQWECQKPGTTTWIKPGATSAKAANYSLTAGLAHNGYKMRCVVTDKNGKKVISDVVTLNVK